jgi:GDP-L-fucose synthase
VIHQAFLSGVQKLLFLGSSCIYPKEVAQPMGEAALLTGKLEPTNEPYAIAKIAGIKMCESYNRQYGHSNGIDYRSVMPTNLYGPGDNYHPENSHVIPALIRRFHEAKISRAPEVEIWGTGKPLREFLYVDDLAEACIFIMEIDKKIYKENTNPQQQHINIGFGVDLSIEQLANKISKVVGYQGKISFNTSMPDGSPKKLMDSTRLNMIGWKPKVDLDWGLHMAYDDFLVRQHQ